MPRSRHTCSLPECSKPADTVHTGHAYCASHRAELNLVRVICTRVHKPAPKGPARIMTPHRDPRRATP